MQTTLLVIDTQVNMFEPDPVHNAAVVLATIRQLIQRARAAGLPIIYVQNSGGAGEPDEPGTPGWAIHPDIAPGQNDAIIEKNTPDPFYQTRLPGVLAERGIGRLIVAGMQSELCIDTACRRASSLGYEVVLAADAHSTFDSVLPAAQIITHHNNVLRAFAAVQPAAEISLDAPPALFLDEPLEPTDLAAIRGGLGELEQYERWLAGGDIIPAWPFTHPTSVTDALRQLWDTSFTPPAKLAPPAGWEMGMARSFIQPLTLMPGFFRRTTVQAVAQAVDHLLQSPTNPFSPHIRKLNQALWSYDAREFRLIYSPRVVQDKNGREHKFVFLLWLAPALPTQNPFA